MGGQSGVGGRAASGRANRGPVVSRSGSLRRGQSVSPAQARRLKSRGVRVPNEQILGSAANRRSNASYARRLARLNG